MLEQLASGVWAANIGINVGVVDLGGGFCAVVDTGLNKHKAKLLLKDVSTLGLKPLAIINTHAHADHFGGNPFVIEKGREVNKMKVAVFCPAIENVTLTYPVLEPTQLFAGASPLPDLCVPFLMGPVSSVDYVIEAEGPLPLASILGIETETVIEAISLPGHSINHHGYLVNGVCFAGDVVLALETIQKHGLPVCYDVANQLATFEKLVSIEAVRFQSCHAPGCDKAGIIELVAINRARMEQVNSILLDALAKAGEEGLDSSAALAALSDGLEAPLTSAQSYWLAHPTVHSYLRWLCGEGVINYELRDNRFFWKSKK